MLKICYSYLTDQMHFIAANFQHMKRILFKLGIMNIWWTILKSVSYLVKHKYHSHF